MVVTVVVVVVTVVVVTVVVVTVVMTSDPGERGIHARRIRSCARELGRQQDEERHTQCGEGPEAELGRHLMTPWGQSKGADTAISLSARFWVPGFP
ncbi:MAG: hypothetical protein ABJC79_05040 [Acidimicrobiia bacterium]